MKRLESNLNVKEKKKKVSDLWKLDVLIYFIFPVAVVVVDKLSLPAQIYTTNTVSI